jgi:biopolymer transport protein TolQ
LDTLLIVVFSLIDQAKGIEPVSAWRLVLQAGLMVKFVILVLALFSVFAWAIIGYKLWQLRKAKNESRLFLKSFWAGESLEQVSISTRRFQSTPLAAVFRAGIEELDQLRRGRKRDDEASLEDISRADMGMENVERALRQAATNELNRLTRFVSFLATTGSTAPFIGLFGTVWGIMTSFQHMAGAQGAGFEVVGRGISEALIATAAGLAAAIPAVVAYNYFLSMLRVIQAELDNFQSEFINIVERHYMKRRSTSRAPRAYADHAGGKEVQ